MKRVRIRGHHLYCLRHLTYDPRERGPQFALQYARIKNILTEESDVCLDIRMGPDELCESCPLYQEGGCTSPPAGEAGVRKLDSIILKSLGIPAETGLTAAEVRRHLQHQKAVPFCSRCHWYQSSVCRPPLDPATSGRDLV